MSHWQEVYSAEELAAALDLHAAQIAKRFGAYDIATEINMAADCIRDLWARVETAGEIGDAMRQRIEAVQKAARATLESLSKLP